MKFQKGDRVMTTLEAIKCSIFPSVRYGTVAANPQQQQPEHQLVTVRVDGRKWPGRYAQEFWQHTMIRDAEEENKTPPRE